MKHSHTAPNFIHSLDVAAHHITMDALQLRKDLKEGIITSDEYGAERNLLTLELEALTDGLRLKPISMPQFN